MKKYKLRDINRAYVQNHLFRNLEQKKVNKFMTLRRLVFQWKVMRMIFRDFTAQWFKNFIILVASLVLTFKSKYYGEIWQKCSSFIRFSVLNNLAIKEATVTFNSWSQWFSFTLVMMQRIYCDTRKTLETNSIKTLWDWN